MKPEQTLELEPVNASPQSLTVKDPESILRYAVDKGATVETIERLMAVRRELRAEQAKEAFDCSLSAFQSECPIIEKRKAVLNKDGRSVRYKYAPLDDIVEQVKGLLQRHGFSYSLTADTVENVVKATCKITHQLGHSEISQFSVPIDPQAFMNEQQKFASAYTYAKRYAFCNALGILTGDEDLDANTVKEKPTGPARPTDKTRARMLELFKEWGLEQKAQAYAIDMALIMPDEGLDKWQIEHVPATKQEMDELRKDIEAA